MDVSEQELRAMVRDAIARQTATTAGPAAGTGPSADACRLHASHGLLPLARGADGDGACLIEPTVRCNHCGYCLSYGH
jgi:hypothetical protein